VTPRRSCRPGRALRAALLACALLPAVAAAELDTLDDVPGSILILPYFEVDLDDPNGPDTVFSVHNRSAVPLIAAVALSTDWGISTLTFAIFLQAYDAQEIRLRDVFRGYFPNLDPPAFCPALGAIAAEELVAAIAAHRGEATNGLCAGQDFDDDLLRGSAFILSPAPFVCDQPGATPSGVIESGENALWGDYYLIDRGRRVAAGDLLFALEATPQQGGATTQGIISLQDDVAPIWGARYVSSADESTDLLAFRASLTGQHLPCGNTPPWFPLSQQELVVFDDGGDAIELTSFRPFPLAASRVRVDSIELPLPPSFSAGWIYVDFGTASAVTNGGGGSGGPTTLSALRSGKNGASLRRGVNFPGAN
jgi:hypothetical protein